MHRAFRLVLLVISLCLASSALAAEWPRFLGPTGNGLAPDQGINKDWGDKPPAVLWNVPLTDNGHAGPSVAAGKVFIVDHAGKEDIVRALSLETGDEVWRYAYADAEKDSYGFARATPTYFEGRIYTLSRTGRLHCLDAETGDVAWAKHLVDDLGGATPGWGYAGSPVVDGDKLIVLPGGKNNVAALDRATGETIWAGGNADPLGYSTPVITTLLGQRQYVVVTGVSALGIHPDTGKVLWRHPWANPNKVNIATPMFEDPYIFLATGYGFGCSVIEVTADEPMALWANREIQAHFSSPLYYQMHIYGVGDPGYLVCLDPIDGSVSWKEKGFQKGGIVIVDDTIIAMDGKNGDVVMVNASPDGYEELGRIEKPLGGRSWTAPIVSDGKLIIRNKSAIACLDLM